MPTIDTARLRELYNYAPETGEFTHANGKHKGRVAGCRDMSKRGYVRLHIRLEDGSVGQFYAHRIAWQYVHGEEASMDIDHKNAVRWDNRIENLRLADRNENQWNYPRPRTNTSGFKGVRACKKTGRFTAYIKQFSVRLYLGTFDTAELASAAYEAKAKELFGAFLRAPANDNVP